MDFTLFENEEEFKKWASKEEFGFDNLYLYEDIKREIKKRKMLWVSIEIPDLDRKMEITYYKIETILEFLKPERVWYTDVGEESYSLFPIEGKALKVIKNNLGLYDFLWDSDDVSIIEITIPGMTDFVILFN